VIDRAQAAVFPVFPMVAAVVSLAVGVAVLFAITPPEFQTAVDHCPQSDLACPSHNLNGLLYAGVAAIPAMAVFAAFAMVGRRLQARGEQS